MDRYWADRLAVAVLGAVLLIGVLWSWNASQQRATSNGMMGSMMNGGMTYGTDPLVYLFGGVLLAVVLGAGYLLTREQLTTPAESEQQPESQSLHETGQTASGEAIQESGSETVPDDAASADVAETDQPSSEIGGELLRYLPDDERRVLEPVIESPGLTQIEIRDRSDFSKSKVSQTLSELEERGLVAREKQGRTYRVTPGPELDSAEDR